LNRRIAVFIVIALALAPEMFAGTWHKSVGAAQKLAKEKNQLILVDMFAQWCGWCHRFEREVFPTAIFQEATKDMVLLKLDTEDRGEGTLFAQKFGIVSLPTFLILAPDLSLAGTIPGYSPPPDFALRLKEKRDQYSVFLNRVKNEDNLGKNWIQRLELAKEFTSRGAFEKSEPRLRKLTVEKGIPAAIRDEAYFQLAFTYARQRKFDEGLKTIRELTKLSGLGESVEAATLLAGEIYLQQGNLLGARNQFRYFLDYYPKSRLAANVESYLSQVEQLLAAKKP
jgi:thioredoxin-related protein